MKRGRCSVSALEFGFTLFFTEVIPCFTLLLSLLFQVVEVGHFWGYRTDGKHSEILKKLTAEIRSLRLAPLSVHPHPDLVCLAPFADFDKQSYFRAQILYVSGNSAEVCFSVAKGNKANLRVYRKSSLILSGNLI